MILVDTALAKRHADGKPVRVALCGAGYMGRGIALQLLTGVRGMTVSAIANRTLPEAVRAYREAGVTDVVTARSARDAEDAVRAGRPCVTEDPAHLADAEGIECFVECTGEIELGASMILRAIDRAKHVVLMNAELDATAGPILKARADRAGVVYTNTDGDEPGVAMNLVRFAETIGYRPVAAGNIKGMLDPYRTPETQREFAEKSGQKAKMITSFADGTKLGMELTVLANATGFRVGRRGGHGPRCKDVSEVIGLFPPEQMLGGGLVDYVLGAAPGTGAWVIGHSDHPIKQQYMKYFKMGSGPFYCFYTPYHLPHIQISTTIARAVLFRDATVAPQGGPRCEVLAVAKRDLKAGETLDGIGGFTCYGVIDNAGPGISDRLLTMGQAEGCRVRRALAKDAPIAMDDVELPPGRLCDRLRGEQNERFFTRPAPAHAGATA
jgi:predicted homoserine dehydrogenase-like protein